MRALLLCFVVGLGAAPMPMMAASFDCRAAKTPQEKTICADPELSKLDESLAGAYRTLRASLSPAGAAEVQEDQRAWLRWVQKVCPAGRPGTQPVDGCFEERYIMRRNMLRDDLHRMAGFVIFSRFAFLTVPDESQDVIGSSDPGFGIGQFSWPEIDRPDAQEALWNKASRAQAVGINTNGWTGSAKPHDFVAAYVTDGETTSSYYIAAIQGKYISIEFYSVIRSYGGAHGNSSVANFAWWLDKGYALRQEDVFRQGSGWKEFLGGLCYRKLDKNEDPQDIFRDPRVAAPQIADLASNTGDWSADAHGLTITFPRSSVGPYSSGMISVLLRWDELQPYLAAGFNGAALPEPLPVPANLP